MPKFFINSNQISQNKIVILGNDVNHIKNVLIKRIDDEILICNKDDSCDYRCKIDNISDDEIKCEILEKLDLDSEPITKVTIFQGLPKADKMELVIQKSVELGDYIAFILPISQYKTTQSLFEFDLVYSEDLGEQTYTDRKLHCCFNIYKLPENGKLNKRPNSKMNFIKIKRNSSKGYNELTDYDIRMCGWGNGSAGKILSSTDKLYACEYKIKILDEKNRDKIVKFFNEFDWNGFTNGIAMKSLKQFHIIDVLKKQFPELS